MYSHNKIPISGSSNRVGRAFRGADPSVPLKSNAALPALQSTKILDQVRERIRYLHFSIRTEQSYRYWIRFYIRWSGTRHPREMGAPEVTSFLTFLANERNVSVSTHRVALSALLFLYQKVLEVNMPHAGVRSFIITFDVYVIINIFENYDNKRPAPYVLLVAAFDHFPPTPLDSRHQRSTRGERSATRLFDRT